MNRLHLWDISNESQWFAFNLVLIEILASSILCGLFYTWKALIKLVFFFKIIYFIWYLTLCMKIIFYLKGSLKIFVISLPRIGIVRISFFILYKLWVLVLNRRVKIIIIYFKIIYMIDSLYIVYFNFWTKFGLVDLFRIWI